MLLVSGHSTAMFVASSQAMTESIDPEYNRDSIREYSDSHFIRTVILKTSMEYTL